MNTKRLAALAAALGSSLALAGCGGGGGGGGAVANNPPPVVNPPPADTAMTVVGPVTGFGSVYVNGIRFDTSDSSYDVDDQEAFDDSALSVGMVVRIEGTVSDDGSSGRADSIEYDDELEGPVENTALDPTDATIKNFTVFGVQVQADENRTVFRAEDGRNFGFDTLDDGDHVEISGFYTDGMLLATYIKQEDANDDDYEAKGTVSGFDGGSFALILADGSQLNVTLAPGAEIPNQGIEDGQYVEVEGTLPDPVGAPRDLLASKVEIEDEDYFDDDDDEAEIKGVLDLANGTWSIGGVTLIFDGNTQYEPASLRDAIADQSAEGRFVEAEGDYEGDALRVREIEIEGVEDDDGELIVRGQVAGVDPANATKVGTLSFRFPPLAGTVEVEINEGTLFADDDSINHFDLSDLNPGSSFAKVKAYRNDAGDLVAARLEREDNSRYEIQAPADAVEPDVAITVLDIRFGLDANTEYDEGVPAAGEFVEVEDDDLDGIADEVDRET
ncbi:MAG: DUF5666 domain-containing protein [Gammaproteobacteria bacterium]